MTHTNAILSTMLNQAPVIPVMVINDIDQAVPMARALVAGGLKVLEITLRTAPALDAIKKIIDEVDGAIVGVGTVNTPAQFEQSHAAGAAFAVSPGHTADLLKAADEIPMPYLPGVATPSEAMQLWENGYRYLKLFPAEAVGGRALLKSIYGPLPDITFCPTGGINPSSAPEYLALPNVICVGGSWMLPNYLVNENKWDEVENLAREAAQLGNV